MVSATGAPILGLEMPQEALDKSLFFLSIFLFSEWCVQLVMDVNKVGVHAVSLQKVPLLVNRRPFLLSTLFQKGRPSFSQQKNIQSQPQS